MTRADPSGAACIRRAALCLALINALSFELVLGYKNSMFGAQRIFSGGPAKGQQVKKVTLDCLNSYTDVYPGKMRCPDTADITEWYDNQGALHRLITHAPLPGVTSHMMRWFFSPGLVLLHPFPKYKGKHIYWYKLWHPIDHEAVIPVPGPHPDVPKLPGLYVYVDEHYRKNSTEAASLVIKSPFFVGNILLTDIQIRFPLGIVLLSLVTRPWYDTPQGLQLKSEIILGLNTPGLARPLNKRVVFPTFEHQLPYALAQLTRHHIEEIGNLAYFLPHIYDEYSKAGRITSALTGKTSGSGSSESAASSSSG